MRRIILIDADNTIYTIHKKKSAYDAMLSYVAKTLKMPFETIKKRFYDIVSSKRESLHPEDHMREVPLRMLGLNEKEIKKAIDIFFTHIISNLILNPGIKDFLDFCLTNKIPVIIFSDEFERFLNLKLSHSLGDSYKRYFYGFITPELTKCMKPCEKYYTYVKLFGYSMENIFLVIGDDYHKDLEIAKEKLSLKTALYVPRTFSSCPADFCFSDFNEIIALIKKEIKNC